MSAVKENISSKHLAISKNNSSVSHTDASSIMREMGGIMREMGVMPLDETSNEERKTSVLASLNPGHPPKVSPNPNRLPKVKRGKKTEKNIITERPGFKAFRDDFVLFRKNNYSKPFGQDQFSKLSDEIILNILKWLPKPVLVKCAVVCKRWNILSCDESLWRRYDFGRKQIKSGTLDTLISRGVCVLRLAMTEIKSPIFIDFPLNQGNMRFSKLQYLDLSMATISEESLAKLLSVCRLLKKLSLEHCLLNEDCCTHIAQNPDLEVLNTAMCCGFTASGVTNISKQCSKLTEWNISWTDLNLSSMVALVNVIPSSLIRLNISGNRRSLDDESVSTIVQRCPNLIELDISDCTLLTTASLLSLIKHCQNLVHLHANRCYTVDPSSFLTLQKLPKFSSLELFGVISDESLKQIRNLAPKIKFNQTIFSSIARPTVGVRRTSIWQLRVRD